LKEWQHDLAEKALCDNPMILCGQASLDNKIF